MSATVTSSSSNREDSAFGPRPMTAGEFHDAATVHTIHEDLTIFQFANGQVIRQVEHVPNDDHTCEFKTDSVDKFYPVLNDKLSDVSALMSEDQRYITDDLNSAGEWLYRYYLRECTSAIMTYADEVLSSDGQLLLDKGNSTIEFHHRNGQHDFIDLKPLVNDAITSQIGVRFDSMIEAMRTALWS